LEWKHYSGDRPAALSERLLAAGFIADPPESVSTVPPDGVELVTVTTVEDVEALVRLHDAVFGGITRPTGRRWPPPWAPPSQPLRP